MSSYINSPEHFNSVQNFLDHKMLSSEKLYSLQDRGKQIDIPEFMNRLRELQVLCVMLQYKKHYEGKLNNEIKTQLEIVKIKTSITRLTDIEGLKALSGIKYQIETYHLKELRSLSPDEESALKMLDKIILELQNIIISRLPEYNSAKWAI